MPTPCPKGRCPARADVYDWNTTEYRKGCRRTQCQTAHRMAEQRRKERRARTVAAEQPAPAAPPVVTEAPPAAEVDLAALVREDLEQLAADHPLRRSLGGICLALAQEIDFLTRAPARSAAVPARQLVEILERLMPTKTRGTLEEELERLFAEDEDDEPAPAG